MNGLKKWTPSSLPHGSMGVPFYLATTVLANMTCDLVWRNLLRISDCKIARSPTWVYAKTMEPEGKFDHASFADGYDPVSTLSIWRGTAPLLERVAGVAPNVAAACMHAHARAWAITGCQ